MTAPAEATGGLCASGQGSRQGITACPNRQRGWAVLAARENRGWTLAECAHASGFSVRQIVEWEHGRRGLTIESLGRLARAYAMTREEVSAIVLGDAPQHTRAQE
ncbi:helix-turn-helix domain-containing protein [Asaia sp. HN010]|uniref:helix-turn-helix domain-containing protein n=1 Tax=Asaia sp. HN010 TaxID=3081233 RepID=UPI0038D227EE